MNQFTFDHLTEVEFEEYCFDLLSELGFVNLNWRKGTPLPSSPADRGRDIECQFLVENVDGSKELELWFVECKHYSHGVPPERLQGALSWAAAERPEWLLVITSGFLSNPAKDYIRAYEANNKPSFKVKLWERPDLERLSSGKIKLLTKYRLPSEFLFVTILHRSHLLYIKDNPWNSLDYFFKVLDSTDAEKRDDALNWAYYFIFPRKTMPESSRFGKFSGPKHLDNYSYKDFKRDCRQLANFVNEAFVVHAIVNWSLSGLFGISDTTNISQRIADDKERIHLLENLSDLPDQDRQVYLEILDKAVEESGELFKNRDDAIASHVKILKQLVEEIGPRTQRNYELYSWFCENVVEKLFQERLLYN